MQYGGFYPALSFTLSSLVPISHTPTKNNLVHQGCFPIRARPESHCSQAPLEEMALGALWNLTVPTFARVTHSLPPPWGNSRFPNPFPVRIRSPIIYSAPHNTSTSSVYAGHSILKPQNNLAESGIFMWEKLAGATGFEPAIFSVTGRCVKPSYTTRPRCREVESNHRLGLMSPSF